MKALSVILVLLFSLTTHARPFTTSAAGDILVNGNLMKLDFQFPAGGSLGDFVCANPSDGPGGSYLTCTKGNDAYLIMFAWLDEADVSLLPTAPGEEKSATAQEWLQKELSKNVESIPFGQTSIETSNCTADTNTLIGVIEGMPGSTFPTLTCATLTFN